MDLTGRTIVVTGVASGIGARTAEHLLRLGADVIGMDRRTPTPALQGFVAMDLSDAASIEAAAKALSGRRIDALVNNAGVSSYAGAVPAIGINFYGLRHLTEQLAPRIREGGTIVNVASIAGFGWRTNVNQVKALLAIPGYPDVAALVRDLGIEDPPSYPLSKEAVVAWTMLAAHRWKDRGIRVNAVSPGPVDTPILGEFRATLGEARVASDIARVGRPGTPSDIAPVVAFLCGDAARWINGANIPCDGGLEASVNAEVYGL